MDEPIEEDDYFCEACGKAHPWREADDYFCEMCGEWHVCSGQCEYLGETSCR